VGDEGKRAVFLDRDGVICRNRAEHVKRWSEFVFLSRTREALARLAYLDLAIVVITNQAAVNRQMVTEETVDEIHRRMVREITIAGGRIDRVYYCPHRPDEGCGCRKPEPGMLSHAALELGIELRGSYIVGDAWSDMQAGLAVGCVPFMVMTGRAGKQAPEAFRLGGGRFRVVSDLSEAVTAILRTEGCSPQEMAWSQSISLQGDTGPLPRFGSRVLNLSARSHMPTEEDRKSIEPSFDGQPAAGIRR
jgi:D-glycero-D-manno-heptose 1,7-bisphosphate phosphatase